MGRNLIGIKESEKALLECDQEEPERCYLPLRYVLAIINLYRVE